MNYILKSESAQYYECGYSCDNAIFLKLSNESFFITDGRYTTEAKESINGAKVIESRNLLKSLRHLIRKSKVKTVIFDPSEWNYFEFTSLKEKLNRINFKPKRDLSPLKRAIKSDLELKYIKKSVELNREGFSRFAKFLSENFQTLKSVSEKSLSYELKRELTQNGEFDLSFEPILAFNENSSKPHALATSKALKEGDLLLLDAGIKYRRYCSDRTRVAKFGFDFNFDIIQKFKSKKEQKIYDTVLKAHNFAIENAQVGMRASEIDKLARDVIDRAGFGKYFTHSTGHGVGLDIHEYPYISAKSDTQICENMVFTIEPGIYIPDEFGIRFENMVVMKSQKVEIL